MWKMYQRSSISKLMKRIHGELIHCTSIEACSGILNTGEILANKGQFEFNYPHSQDCFGFRNGWICLFDLACQTERELAIHHFKWQSFFLPNSYARVICMLDRSSLKEDLIPNSRRPLPQDEDYATAFPYVEAWYPKPIPVQNIKQWLFTVEHRSGLRVSSCNTPDVPTMLRKLALLK